MVKILPLLLLMLTAFLGQCQQVDLDTISRKLAHGQAVGPADFGFREYQVYVKSDTVHFYTWQRPGTHPTSVYLFLPGTNAENIYTYHTSKPGSYWYTTLGSFDFSFLPDDYLYLIVAKPGFGFIGNGDINNMPLFYWARNSLDDRVMRADAAINYARKHLVKSPERIVVFGYSEGFYVGAKLGTVNRHITHLGIGGGGGYPDLYDFILSDIKATQQGKLQQDTAIASSESSMADFRRIMQHPADTSLIYDYSYKRWASYSLPPVTYLSRLKIPLYQVHGMLDDNTPVENAYIVPVEFTRLGKTNLTFRVWPNTDHSLTEHLTNGREIRHWNEMMADFFNWVKANSRQRRY